MRAHGEVLRWAGRALPVALCALTGHFALYGTLTPADRSHAYFRWYEPLVAGLSVASVLVLAGLLLASAVGGDRERAAVARFLTPVAVADRSLVVRASRLALASSAFLFVQESIERSVAAGRVSPAAFSSDQMLLLLLALGLVSSVVAHVERWCGQIAALVVRRVSLSRSLGRRSEPKQRYSQPTWIRRRNPLAERYGFRAPPCSI